MTEAIDKKYTNNAVYVITQCLNAKQGSLFGFHCDLPIFVIYNGGHAPMSPLATPLQVGRKTSINQHEAT